VTPIYGEDPEEFDHWIEESAKRARLVDFVDCKPVGLCEPFKVRVITRGDADVYHLCRRYQKIIHRQMSDHPTFNLTKGPITQEQLDEFWSVGQHFVKKGWNIISGDYEAATDYIDPELSEFCLTAILDTIGCPDVDKRVLLLALTGHRIHFKGPKGLQYYKQLWGQLMGSPISFPILCIINAAATKLALELGDSFLPLEPRMTSGTDVFRPSLCSYPLKINGDDVGFMADDNTYSIWKKVTAVAGLKFSMGKNYSHKDCLILNSAVFRVDVHSGVLSPLRHLQVGLLYGQSEKFCRPVDREEESPLGESEFLGSGYGLSQMCRDLLTGWSEDQQDVLLSRFITVNRDRLERIPRGMSWWLPRSLGGLGLPHVKDANVTEGQLRLAAYLATRSVEDKDLGDFLHPNLPLFLSAYLSNQGIAAKVLGAHYREYSSFEEKRLLSGKLTLPMLESYALKGAFCELENHEESIRRSFRGLWDRAMKTGLSPMGKEKSLLHQRPRAREVPQFSGRAGSSGSAASFAEACDCLQSCALVATPTW
jgi:hypothetical protein